MSIKFIYKSMEFSGISEGGIRTSVVAPRYNLMFDIGCLPVDYVHIGNILLTHAHLDHSAGVPYYVSQRSLRNLKAPNIYVHENIYEPFSQILSIYQKMEGFDYKYNLLIAEKNKFITISPNLCFKAIETYHRVSSQGYTVYEKSSKLKEEFSNLEGKEIAKLRLSGQIITEEKLTPTVSFSGDTKIEYVLNNKDVANSKVLFLECTYLCEERDIKRARDWGHLHLDEIAANAKEFQNERLVLIHFSKRYKYKTILEAINKKLPKELRERTVCFLPNFPGISSN